MPTILGVDLGVRNTGLALIQVPPEGPMRLMRTDTIGLPLKTHPDRIVAYYRQHLRVWIRNAHVVGSEAVTFFSKAQERRKQARGAPPTETWVKIALVYSQLYGACLDQERPFRSIQPPALKQIVTGVRAGGKTDMVAAVKAMFPDFEDSHHAADAILAGLACHAPERLVCGGRAVAQ